VLVALSRKLELPLGKAAAPARTPDQSAEPFWSAKAIAFALLLGSLKLALCCRDLDFATPSSRPGMEDQHPSWLRTAPSVAYKATALFQSCCDKTKASLRYFKAFVTPAIPILSHRFCRQQSHTLEGAVAQNATSPNLKPQSSISKGAGL